MTRISIYVLIILICLCVRSSVSFANVNGVTASNKRIPSSSASTISANSIINTRSTNTKFHGRLSPMGMKLQPRLMAAIDPSVFGGVLSGCLHSITGPDHLAAILPSSVGKSGWYGAKVGAVWGLGHGLSATILGFCVFFLKDKLGGMFTFVEKLTNVAESAVGLSLVAIGLLGVKESLETGHDEEDDTLAGKGGKSKSYRAIFANGLLHGFSWDGAPSIAPAIAMTSWKSASLFFGAYSFGAMITMSVVAGLIAFLSSRMGELSNNPQLPKKLSLISSLIAVAIGLYWLIQAFLAHK